MPVAVTDDYVARCRDLGADVVREVINKCGHFSLIDPEDPAFVRVIAVCRSLARA